MSSRIAPATKKANGIVPQAVSTDDLGKFQQDLNILTQKLTELQAASASSFVAGLRSSVEGERKSDVVDKISMLESILSKIVEVDRHVLRITEPQAVEQSGSVTKRRMSRGMDLFTLPTHLHLIDRLMDLHVQQKRVTVIKNIELTDAPAIQNHTVPIMNTGNQESEREVSVLRKQLSESENKRRELEQQLSVSESKRKAAEEQIEQFVAIKAQLANSEKDFKKKMHDSEAASKKELIDLDTKTKLAEEENAVLQSKVKVFENNLAAAECSLRDSEALCSKLQEELQVAKIQSLKLSESQSVQNSSEISEIKSRCSSMELKIEQSESNYSKLISAILNFSNSVRDRRESLDYFRTLVFELDSSANSALIGLGTSLISRLDGMQAELLALIAQKDDLENELSTSSLQRTLLSGDLCTLSSEHEVLKGAYQAIEYELATFQQKNSSDGVNEKELLIARQKVADLGSCLAEAVKKISELEKGAELIIQLTAKVAAVQDKNFELEAKLREMNETVEMHKATSEGLRKKLKEIAGADSRDFMDSFEEVMREEMLTMKSAFENKLKLAKEESEKSSRRHQQAIQQLMALSPSSSASQLQTPSIGMK